MNGTGLVVPPLDRKPWPTLGPQVCEFIESYLVYGPGDLRGEPARLDDETRALIYRMYEVFPKDHAQAGRRRFKRVALSLRKGSAKTEKAAWIAAVELHPEGPVRCDGWRRVGKEWEPVGAPVRDPYIPMVAYTEEQSEDLAYGALYVMLSEGPLADDFDIGLERIMRIRGDGKAVALASAPDARDGARTTFQHFDETHRFTLPRLREAHRTMLANLPKRKIADAWALETTTAPAPGESSVAEHTMDYARQVDAGKIADSRLFFFHRQASDRHDLSTDAGIRAAVIEASGPVAEWSDLEGIIEQWRDPTADRAYLERVWLNRLVKSAEQAFDAERWKALGNPARSIPDKAMVTIGFDGSRTNDSTALVACEVATGLLQPLAVWERPAHHDDWEVPADEVDAAVDDAMARFEVLRMYCDPAYWETYVAAWAGRYGKERVFEWWTYRTRPMAQAIRSFASALSGGELAHTGDATLTAHIGNAHRRVVPVRDEDGQQLWVVEKERKDSPHKMDAAMAAILAWEARRDAIAAGALEERPSVYEGRGALTFG